MSMKSAKKMTTTIIIIIMTYSIKVSHCNVIPDGKESIKNYLAKYGHHHARPSVPGIIKNSLVNSIQENIGYQNAIKDFQKTVGLKPNGIVDEKTLSLMKMPRCGVVESSFKSRNKRRTDIRWPFTRLKYRFLSYTTRLPTQSTRETVRQAFKKWTDVTPLYMVEAQPWELSDVTILFARGDHGDGFPFDGPSNGLVGNTLAHTFFPMDGRSHFDDDEDWTVGTYTGYNFLTVATHEFGHVFGLNHSPDPRDIMYALYRPFSRNFAISQSDVAAIQRLYGPANIDGLPLTPQEGISTSTITTTITNLPRIGTPPNNSSKFITQPWLTTPNMIRPIATRVSMLTHPHINPGNMKLPRETQRTSIIYKTFSRTNR